ncbi:MAG: hypothetical protein V7785_00600 [Bermanella sp.]
MKVLVLMSLFFISGCATRGSLPDYTEPAGEDVATLVVDFKDNIRPRKFTLDGLINGSPELYIANGDMVDENCSVAKDHAIDRPYEEYGNDENPFKKLTFKVPANEEFRFYLPARTKITKTHEYGKTRILNTFCFAHVSFLPELGMDYQAEFIQSETDCTFDIYQKQNNGEKEKIKYNEHPPCVIKERGDTKLNRYIQNQYKWRQFQLIMSKKNSTNK